MPESTDHHPDDLSDNPSGPWLAALVVALPVPLVSKSNHRQTRSSDWRALRGFEDAVAYAVRGVLPANWPALDASVPLADRPVVTVSVVSATRLDAANVPKSLTDALEGVCYVNDASAASVHCVTRRSATSHTVIGVAACPPHTDIAALAEASTCLTAHTIARFKATLAATPDA